MELKYRTPSRCPILGIPSSYLFSFQAGNYSICLRTEGICGSATSCQQLQITPNESFFKIGGTIVTLNNQPISNLTVQINTSTTNTNSEGQYESTLVNENTYTIRPTKNDNPLLGVSISDAIPIQRHILSVSPIPTLIKSLPPMSMVQERLLPLILLPYGG